MATVGDLYTLTLNLTPTLTLTVKHSDTHNVVTTGTYVHMASLFHVEHGVTHDCVRFTDSLKLALWAIPADSVPMLVHEPAIAAPTTKDSPVRQLAKALFIQAVPRPEICRRTGVPYDTLNVWAKRDGWVELRDAIPRVNPGHASVTITQQRPAFPVRAEALAKAHKLLRTHPDRCPKSSRDRRDTLVGFKSLIDSLSQLEGWSDNTGTIILNIDELAQQPTEVIALPADIPNISAETQPIPEVSQ